MAEPSSRASPFLAGSGLRLFGRYILIGKLGAGGQAEVWRARDETRGAEIALKILRPALAESARARAALTHEYAIASRLDHPLILKIYAPERDARVAALPMEFAPGGDLKRLRGARYLEIVPVLMEVAEALAHAHARGVVHRDLKPGNVLFDANGHVRLADFGSADSLTAAGARTEGSLPSVSPFSASPEQLRGEPASAADDIYGLGALAYELLSGYPPYYPQFDLARALAEPVSELKPAHHAPDPLIELVMAMLAKRGADRPPSMLEVSEQLAATLNDTQTFTFELPPSSLSSPASLATVPLDELLHGVPTVEPARAFERAFEPESEQPVDAFAASAPTKLRTWREAPSLRVVPLEPSSHPPDPAPDPAPEPPRNPAVEPPADQDLNTLWAEFGSQRAPSLMRLEPMKHSRWPWIMVLAVVIALGAVASSVWLPRWAPDLADWSPRALRLPHWLVPAGVTQQLARIEDHAPGIDAAASAPGAAPAPTQSTPAQSTPAPSAGTQAAGGPVVHATQAVVAPAAAAHPSETSASRKLLQQLRHLDTRLARLARQGARVSDDADYTAARKSLRQARQAAAAGRSEVAAQRLARAGQQIDALERSIALDSLPVAAPRSARARAGVERLLADGARAEATREYARAVQDYAQALSLDPVNAVARAGVARASASLGSGDYAKQLALGLAALGAGQLDAARTAFLAALRVDSSGREAAAGLAQVSAALRAQAFVELRNRAAQLESEDRYGEALQTYDAALRIDPSLSAAQQRRARAVLRGQLARRLRSLLDDPESLASPATREQAVHLIAQSRVAPPDPAVRALAARLETLLPQFQQVVHLALVSDDATEVQISEIGSFGMFSRRELDLKPGKYTVIGTRAGYREVRESLTLEPGQDGETISVRCTEPI
ncbi:MAG TPA: protein kinase [Steroidobacteraceae bacterium]|nr:protein kinase [Steroidobacteraceae bacterium]